MIQLSRHTTFRTVRVFDPGAGTTFTESDWVLTQDIAAAEASNSTFSVNSFQAFPALLRFYTMTTLLGSDGKPIALQGDVKIATLSIDEITIVNGEKRLVHFGSSTEHSSNGLKHSATIGGGLGHGTFVIRMTNVTAMPAGVKKLSTECKFRIF